MKGAAGMVCAGVMLACVLISSNMGTRWDAWASGPHAYAMLLQGGCKRISLLVQTQTHCLLVGGSGRRRKNCMFVCCAPLAAAYECRWAAADASTTCAWKILLKSSCPQGRGALPARDSSWIQTLLASGPTSRPCPSLHKPRRALYKPRRALHKPRRAWIWFWIPLPILSVSFSEICATCWSFSHVCLCPRFFQPHNDSATQRQSQRGS